MKGGSSSYSYNVWNTAAEMNPTNEYWQSCKEWATAHLEPGDELFIKESAWKWEAYLEPSYKYNKCTRHAQTLHSMINAWPLTPNTHINTPWPSAQNFPPPYVHADCSDMTGAGEKEQRKKRTDNDMHQSQRKANDDVEQKTDLGMRFMLCAYTACPFRPEGMSRVDPETLVADLRAIRDWELFFGNKWEPYPVS